MRLTQSGPNAVVEEREKGLKKVARHFWAPVPWMLEVTIAVLQLRDILLARAEEETCREIVHRVPVSQELKARIEQRALDDAEEADPVSATKPASLSESP